MKKKTMMMQINNKFEEVLDAVSEMRSDIDSIKDYIGYMMNDRATISRRLTKLEKKIRK